MPAKKPLTLGAIAKKVSAIRATQFLYILLLITVFLLGYLIARVQMLEKGNTNGSTPPTQTAQTAPPGQPQGKVDVKTGKLPVFGKSDAKVTMIEFSDFECPFCKRFFDDTLAQIKKEYVDTGKVKLYYRHFPLDFHPAAMPAALASECANEQDKFWQYHDKIFEKQDQIAGGGDKAAAALKQFALDVGLNTTQFNQCFDNKKYEAQVTQDTNDGKAAGVSGTPTFFINGKMLVGAQPFASFKAIIDEELK